RGAQLERLKQVISLSVKSLGIVNGCIHVECCTLPDGQVKLFELGLRPGGGGTPDPIVPWISGIQLSAEYIRLCAGDVPETLEPTTSRACNYHFITPEPGKIATIAGLEAISAEDVLDFAFFPKTEDTIKEVRAGSDRSGFIIVGGDTAPEVLQRGYELENRIKIEYC
ncbi:MAG: hypothetical protein K8S56_00535, partial [Candidatus Cloacimonetes bacterium]|nr:hypothetical protein [Candidatus Cloacimonadota bacterium]